MVAKLITIQTETGEKQINASVFGRFAVHQQASWNSETGEFYFDNEWWSVTHIPTGRSVMRIIETRKAALAFAKRINEEFDDSLIAAAIAGEDTALKAFSRLIKRWYNDFGAIYSY